jgi:hypothetical protein
LARSTLWLPQRGGGRFAHELNGVAERTPDLPACLVGRELPGDDRTAVARSGHRMPLATRLADDAERRDARREDDPEALESWAASTAAADYLIRLVRRPRAGLQLIARKDLRGGAGFRTVRKEPFQTPRRARQVMRGWLVDVVESRSL